MITDIVSIPMRERSRQAGCFRARIRRGTELYVMGTAKKVLPPPAGRDLHGALLRVEVEEITAGNIAAVTGLKDAIVGSTVTSCRK
jgi:elongation factor 2